MLIQRDKTKPEL